MFVYLDWVSKLQGISPIARLLGIRMANWAGYVGTDNDLGPEQPACQIDLDAALAWIGCSESELRAAMGELELEGVRPIRIEARKILYTFPVLEDWEETPVKTARVDPLTIYVIRADIGDVVKIGISKYPDYRLQNLQAANPVQRLNFVFKFEGTASVIRRVEREAHAALSDKALGNEWFGVRPEIAINVVKGLLAKAGLSA